MDYYPTHSLASVVFHMKLSIQRTWRHLSDLFLGHQGKAEEAESVHDSPQIMFHESGMGLISDLQLIETKADSNVVPACSSFLHSLPPELLSFILRHLLEQADTKSFSSLMRAYPDLAQYVLFIYDDHTEDQSCEMKELILSSYRIFPEVVQCIPLSHFQKLHPTSELKHRLVKIFSIGSCQSMYFYQPLLRRVRESGIRPLLADGCVLIFRVGDRGPPTHKEAKMVSRYIRVPKLVYMLSVICDTSREIRNGLNHIPSGYRLFTPAQIAAAEKERGREVVEFFNIGRPYPTAYPYIFGSWMSPVLKINLAKRCTWSFRGSCRSYCIRISHSPRSHIEGFKSLQVKFGCSTFPTIKLYDHPCAGPGCIQVGPEEVVLINTTWTEENPFGVTCQHASERNHDSYKWMVRSDTQEMFCYRDSILNQEFRSALAPFRVDFQGIPDRAMTLISFHRVKTFTWLRLSPSRIDQAEERTLNFPVLVSMKIVSLIRKDEEMPILVCPSLTKLELVALKNSTAAWDVGSFIRETAKLQHLALCAAPGSDLRVSSKDFAKVATTIESLNVSGFSSAFVGEPGPSVVFPKLTSASIDISQAPFANLKEHSMGIVFGNMRFPVLEKLRLRTSPQYAHRFRGGERDGISLCLFIPDSCNEVSIGSEVCLRALRINGRVRHTTNTEGYCTGLPYGRSEGIWRKHKTESKFGFVGTRATLDRLVDYAEGLGE